MDWFWNWSGECFGYREGDSLFTYFGKEVGRFDGSEIHGSNGRYGWTRMAIQNNLMIDGYASNHLVLPPAHSSR